MSTIGDVLAFARAVLPDLLSHLFKRGEPDVGQAFKHLGDLWEMSQGNSRVAREGIRNIQSRKKEIATRRKKRDKEFEDLKSSGSKLKPSQSDD